MSGASKTNSPLVLYAEGVDPEADLVLVCGERKFFVQGIHASTTVALFQHVVRKFDTATRYESDMRNLKAGNVVKYALHEQRER